MKLAKLPPEFFRARGGVAGCGPFSILCSLPYTIRIMLHRTKPAGLPLRLILGNRASGIPSSRKPVYTASVLHI